MFTLNEVVPWGRSFDEYLRMFALTPNDLNGRILGCADGPASFNAEATGKGMSVVSCDPLYRYSPKEIHSRIDQTFETVIEQTRRNQLEFIWDQRIPDIDTLGRIRMASMLTFLDDFSDGRDTGRYVEAGLPNLPFADDSFDMALCSHFLFLYSKQFTVEFHVASMLELCRISPDVRVFPLVELGGNPSCHLDAVLSQLQRDGFLATVEPVPYEFQRGGNQMLRVRRKTDSPITAKG